MVIDIYSKYKVRFLNTGAYISQEDSTPDDIVFHHYEDDSEEIINGGELLDIIKYRLNDDYLQDFSVLHNTIRIEVFNPMNGTGHKYVMIIERYNESKGE